MYAVREAPSLQALSAVAVAAAWWWLALPAPGAEEGVRRAEEVPEGKRDGEEPASKRVRVILKPEDGSRAEDSEREDPPEDAGDDRPAPPAHVKLPRAGTHPAREILPLAGALAGRNVVLDGARLGEFPVEIPRALAESEVGWDELGILLAAAQIHLFEHEDPEEGKVLVATRNPRWKPEPEGHVRVLEPDPGTFATVAEAVRKVVEQRNEGLPRDETPMVAVDARRAGKIIISSPRKEDLAAIDEAVDAFLKKDKERERPHIYTYVGRHRRVEELLEDLQGELEDGERNLLRIIVSGGGKGNRLLYRCPEALGEKVKGLLEKLDVTPKAPSRAPHGATPGAGQGASPGPAPPGAPPTQRSSENPDLEKEAPGTDPPPFRKDEE